MKNYLHIVIAFPLLLGAIVWQGRSSDRWGIGDDVKKAAERLNAIPLTIETKDDSGKTEIWKGTDRQISDKQLEGAEAVGYISRRYVLDNPASSKIQGIDSSVDVIVLCGRPGPISLHPPTICFPSTGRTQQGEVKNFLVRSSERSPLGEIQWCEFAKKEEKNIRHSLTIWTWSTGDTIEVPENPRRTFASRGFLYKIYVIRERLVPPGETEEFSLENDELSVRFLQAFIPELKKALHKQKSD